MDSDEVTMALLWSHHEVTMGSVVGLNLIQPRFVTTNRKTQPPAKQLNK
jgi:hypothetical protein